MAALIKRTWSSRGPTGHKVKHVAHGYTLQIHGKQERKTDARWSKEDAQAALARGCSGATRRPPRRRSHRSSSARPSSATSRRSLARSPSATTSATWPPSLRPSARTRRCWRSPRRGSARGRRSGSWRSARRRRRPTPLRRSTGRWPVLRHLLRLAHDEWEVLAAAPRIRLEREPQGRVRWLEPADEGRLIEACRTSRTKHLADVVTVALETGLRKAELLGLTWDRVDLSRGVLRLEVTKSGRRREVPMRQAVYDLLAAMPGPREGRLWPARKIRTAFESAVTAAGLEDFRFHDCRHHFASWFMMRGGSLQALKELLGHQDIKTTLIYAHLSPAHLRAEVAETERPAMPAPTPDAVSTKSAQSSAAAVESEERVG